MIRVRHDAWPHLGRRLDASQLSPLDPTTPCVWPQLPADDNVRRGLIIYVLHYIRIRDVP